MKTRIIVDSTADLLPEYKSRVNVVPLMVRFDDEEFIDGVTIDHKTFYEKLVESDVLPTTSQANPDAFMTEFEKVLKNRDGMTEDEAKKERARAREEISNIIAEGGSYDEVEELLSGDYGLEMDYIFDLL